METFKIRYDDEVEKKSNSNKYKTLPTIELLFFCSYIQCCSGQQTIKTKKYKYKNYVKLILFHQRMLDILIWFYNNNAHYNAMIREIQGNSQSSEIKKLKVLWIILFGKHGLQNEL